MGEPVFIIVFIGHRSDGGVDVMMDEELQVTTFSKSSDGWEALRGHLLEDYGEVVEVMS